MRKEEMTLVFNSDYSPRKKGEKVVFKGHDEIKTAEWYLSNGIANECGCDEDKEDGGCSGCNENAEKGKLLRTEGETANNEVPEAGTVKREDAENASETISTDEGVTAKRGRKPSSK